MVVIRDSVINICCIDIYLSVRFIRYKLYTRRVTMIIAMANDHAGTEIK